jgi:hypothetical protein
VFNMAIFNFDDRWYRVFDQFKIQETARDKEHRRRFVKRQARATRSTSAAPHHYFAS